MREFLTGCQKIAFIIKGFLVKTGFILNLSFPGWPSQSASISPVGIKLN